MGEVATETPAVVAAVPETQEEITNLESEIIRQIEYYFSDSNLRRDKFLSKQISDNEGGWVELAVLLTFKRLKSMSDDASVIVAAVQKSSAGLVEVSEDKLKLRRHPDNPIPEFNDERRKEQQTRTAYAKGFPLDTTISELIEYFNGFEKVVNVSLRKYFEAKSKTYLFKGSVFVTFLTKEQCEEFVKKDKIMYKDVGLLRHTQTDYFVLKREEKEEKEKKRTKKFGGKGSDRVEPAKDVEIELPKNTVLHFKDVKDYEMKREQIKDALMKIDPLADVAYIDFNKGDEQGWIRFAIENDAPAMLEKLTDKKLKVNEESLEMRILEGDEETQFFEKVRNDMKLKKKFAAKGKRGGGARGGGRGGRGNSRFGGGRKRKFGEENDDSESPARPTKKTTFEDVE